MSVQLTPGSSREEKSADSQQAAWQVLVAARAISVDGKATADSALNAFCQAWLILQGGMLPGGVRGVLVLGPPDAGPYAPVAFWPVGQATSALLAEAAEGVLAARQPLLTRSDPHSVVAYPINLDGHLHGLVAFETAAQTDADLNEAMHRVQWGLAGIEAALYRQQSGEEQSTRERLIATLDLVASTLTEDGYLPAAQALVTDLALKLDCDRVSFGFQRNLHSQVVAVSHSAQFGKRINLIRAIGLAMDEAVDQRAVIVIPSNGADTLVTRDHAALARQHGSDCILTIPFQIGSTSTGAFTFERPGIHPFDTASVELCQAVVAMCSRMLDEKRLNDRSLPRRIADGAREQLARMIGPRYFGRKLFAAVLVASVVFFSVYDARYRVGANAALEGFVRRVLVAPFDGYISATAYRAGDVVAAGTIIATLDDRDLRLDYLKWASQQAQYSKQYQEAVGQRDRAQINIIRAQVQQAQAQMDLLAEQLARTRIKAPFAGVIVSGDLSQSLGGAVKRGEVLFEIAPLNSYRVVLEVDEGEIIDLKPGQKGNMLLAALPGREIPLTTLQLTPVTVSREGRTYFRVEAVLEQAPSELRPGMEGVAKIEVGERKLIWIWTHKLIDWLRLTLWPWI